MSVRRRRPFGIRDDDLVAGFDQRLRGEVDPVHAAVGHQHFVGITTGTPFRARSFAASNAFSRGRPAVCR